MKNNYRIIESNQASLIGTVSSGFTYSHETCGEKFYLFDLCISRFSGFIDKIPVMVSERIMSIEDDWIGCGLKIEGNFRSHRKHIGNNNRLILYVFARMVENAEEEYEKNEIFLDGYICKPTTYRKTLYGRDICDIFLAVNRSYKITDYIPCICWGRNAIFAGELNTGQRIKLFGRIQSREYKKQYEDGTCEERVAYEVSCNRIEAVDYEK